MQEVGDDPVLQEREGPVGLPRRKEVPGRLPRVAPGFQPFRRPQLQRNLPRGVSGMQFGAQHLVHQVVVPVDRPVIIKRDEEQVGRLDAAQQRRRVQPAGDNCAGLSGQLIQNRGIQHKAGHLRWLLFHDLTDEVLGDRVA